MTDADIYVVRMRTDVMEKELTELEDKRNSLIARLGINYKLIMEYHESLSSEHNVSGNNRGEG